MSSYLHVVFVSCLDNFALTENGKISISKTWYLFLALATNTK